MAVEGGCDPRVAASKLAPAEISYAHGADDIAHPFFRGIRKLKAAWLVVDFDLVGGESIFLSGDFEASAQGQRGEVVEGDILRRGAEVQRETVFRPAAAADDDAAEFDIEPLDTPSRRGRIGAGGHPFLGCFHVGKEVLADVDDGM